MDIRRFSQQLRAVRERLSEAPPSAASTTVVAVLELEAACEGLNAAEEELLQQNEELLRAQAALEIQQRRYAELFELAPDGYLVTDRHGNIREANRAAREMLGLPESGVVHKPLVVYVDAAQRRAFRTHLAHLFASHERPHEWEARLVPPGRPPFYGSFTMAVATTPTAHEPGVRWLLRDVTEKKEAQDLLRRHHSELESQVAIRTAELTAANRAKDVLLAEAQAARAEAERANQAKDSFLATLSHELRTPLGAVLGWSHVLRQSLNDEIMRRRAVESIERSAHAQVKLVEDILDVSRIVSDRLVLDPAVLDFARLVETAVNALRPSAQEAGLQLVTQIEPDIPVCADPDRLQQVVWNLVSNALKFTPRGGRVEISARRQQGQAILTVADTGKGIAPELLPFVFDRFRQGHRSARTQGLGLGLAIAHHIVERHGGRVRASSEGAGRGATFVVELPVHVGGTSWPNGLDRRRRTRTGYFIGSLVRVLVVEDDRDTREALATALGNAGFQVQAAGGACEAVELFDALRPDVVVSDIAMPEEDGCSLLERLRDRDGSAHFGAIALTAYASADEAARAKAAGFDEYMVKPASMSDLTAAVAALALRSERPL